MRGRRRKSANGWHDEARRQHDPDRQDDVFGVHATDSDLGRSTGRTRLARRGRRCLTIPGACSSCSCCGMLRGRSRSWGYAARRPVPDGDRAAASCSRTGSGGPGGSRSSSCPLRRVPRAAGLRCLGPPTRTSARGLRDRPLGRIAASSPAMLVAALLVSRSCGETEAEMSSQDEAVAIAEAAGRLRGRPVTDPPRASRGCSRGRSGSSALWSGATQSGGLTNVARTSWSTPTPEGERDRRPVRAARAASRLALCRS